MKPTEREVRLRVLRISDEMVNRAKDDVCEFLFEKVDGMSTEDFASYMAGFLGTVKASLMWSGEHDEVFAWILREAEKVSEGLADD